MAASGSMLPDPSARRLARTLAQIQGDLETMKAGQRASQLDYSSLLYPLVIRDPATGDVVGSIGQQPDGGVATIPVGGPPPPTPTDPFGTPGTAVVMWEWDGRFAGGAARPSNFAFVVLHVSGAGPNFVTDPSNAVGTLTDAGQIPVTQTGQQWARLVAYSTSTPPVTSSASGTATATPAQVVAQAVLDGIVSTVALADRAVSTAKAGLAMATADIVAAAAITAPKVDVAAVGASALAVAAVTGPKLADAAVGAPALAASSVTANAIAANAVTTPAVQADAVTAAQIAAAAVATSELAALAVSTGNLQAVSVAAGKVAANAISANELQANSVGTAQLIAGSVQAGDLAANSVTTLALASGSVTADQIAVNAVTAGALAAGSVTATKLAAVLAVATRFIASTGGVTTGTRAEMNAAGFEAWNGSLQTFNVNAATGAVMMLGTYRTAAAGVRGEFGTDGTLTFYPSSGTNAARLRNLNGDLSIEGQQNTGDSNRRGFVTINEGAASLNYGTPGGSVLGSWELGSTFINGKAPVIVQRIDGGRSPADGTARRFAWLFTTSGGSDSGPSVLHLQNPSGAGGRPFLFGANNDAGVVFDAGFIAICANDITPAPINASAFRVVSSSQAKTNITEIGFTDDQGAPTRALDAVMRAGARRYQYATDLTKRPGRPGGKVRRRVVLDGAAQTFSDGAPVMEEVDAEWSAPPRPAPFVFGPMAEDLPDSVVEGARGSGSEVVNVASLVGVLWQAVRELTGEVRALQTTRAAA